MFTESTKRTQYLLLSHVLGRAAADGQIPNRVRMEQAMATVLGCGLCAPLHIKTLKAITGVSAFPPTSYRFVRFLVVQMPVLCRQGPLVLVVDDVPDLRPQHEGRFCELLQSLLQGGIEVLLAEHNCFLTRMRSLQSLMSPQEALRLYLRHRQGGMPGERLPTAVYFAPVQRSWRRGPGARAGAPAEHAAGGAAHG